MLAGLLSQLSEGPKNNSSFVFKIKIKNKLLDFENEAPDLFLILSSLKIKRTEAVTRRWSGEKVSN